MFLATGPAIPGTKLGKKGGGGRRKKEPLLKKNSRMGLNGIIFFTRRQVRGRHERKRLRENRWSLHTLYCLKALIRIKLRSQEKLILDKLKGEGLVKGKRRIRSKFKHRLRAIFITEKRPRSGGGGASLIVKVSKLQAWEEISTLEISGV